MKNNRNRYFGIVVVLIIFVVGVIYYSTSRNQENKTEDKVLYSSVKDSENKISNEDLETYTNKLFGYSLEYQDGVEIQNSVDLNIIDVTESDHVVFFIPGYALLVGVDIWDDEKNLNDFAIQVRNAQIEEKNKSEHLEIEVGEMTQIEIGGKDAYAFTLTGGFQLYGWGYTLGVGKKYTYIITENQIGKKYIVRYLNGNKQAKNMIDSFTFLNVD